MKDLEQKIHEYIEHLYNAKFIGKLRVKKYDDIYELRINIPIDDISTTMSLQTDSEEEFFCYICEEFRRRNYMRVKYYTVKRTN